MAFIKTPQKVINKLLGNLKNTPQRTILPKRYKQRTATKQQVQKLRGTPGRPPRYVPGYHKGVLIIRGKWSARSKSITFSQKNI